MQHLLLILERRDPVLERILGCLRRAVDDYDMIEEGEKVVVGVSGGKDSMLLFAALSRLAAFHPKHFSVTGLMLNMGFEQFDPSSVLDYCGMEGLDLRIVDTDISKIVFDIRKEPNPCSLCAKLRRGALHNEALKLGSTKIALGHHADDAIETFTMNLFFEGRIGCYSPVTYLDRKGVTVIRPLLYVTERDIRNAVRRLEIPVMGSGCPENGETGRQEIKDILSDLEKRYPGLRARMYGALQRSGIDGWQEFPKGRKV